MALPSKIAERFIRQVIEQSRSGIGLDLLVPGFRVESGKPIAKRGQLGPGKLPDRGFDFVDGAHKWKLADRVGEARMDEHGVSRTIPRFLAAWKSGWSEVNE
jgi:hypothetical protein